MFQVISEKLKCNTNFTCKPRRIFNENNFNHNPNQFSDKFPFITFNRESKF